MFKKLSFTFAALGALLLTGCLEFEQQTLIYRYDAKTDTLRIFQVYRGIFGADKPDGLSDQELEQLQSVLTTQRTFFFANWIAEYDRTKVREALDNLKKPEDQQEAKRDPATRARLETFYKLLLDNVRVENGAFYIDTFNWTPRTDCGTRLNGVQRVTVTQFSKLIAAANEPIRDLVKSFAGDSNASTEERALYLKFSEQQQPCLVLAGNQLHLRLPILRPEYEKLFSGTTNAPKQLECFKGNGGKLSFADNEMKWSISMPADSFNALTLPVAEKPYVTNAVDAVKSRATIRNNMDVFKAANDFFSEANQEKKPAKP